MEFELFGRLAHHTELWTSLGELIYGPKGLVTPVVFASSWSAGWARANLIEAVLEPEARRPVGELAAWRAMFPPFAWYSPRRTSPNDTNIILTVSICV